jgi:glycosyltransferase involved in cell wall biosynthesis
MALGCRIVASDTPPVREVIEEGRTGRLFPFFDREALVRRVGEALSDPAGSERMAQAARERALAQYDFRTVCLPQWRRFLKVS